MPAPPTSTASTHGLTRSGGQAIRDPEERLRHALGDLYAWYGRTEQMLSNTSRDAARVPAPARRSATLDYFERRPRDCFAGRLERGRPRTRAAAGIGHAISFPTWRSLVREQGLDETDAVELMVGWSPQRRG